MRNCLLFFLLLNIISCNKQNIDIIKIGHIGEFDYDIWSQINEELAIENARLEIVYFNDYDLLNKALNDGKIDLNIFQNYIYFVNETNKYDYKLAILEKTFVASMNIYSKFITNINQVSSNAKIAIPDDEVNLSRALQVIQTAGLIKLERFDNSFYNLCHIVENKLNLQFIPMEASFIFYDMDKVDAAVINYGFINDYKNYNIIYYDDIEKYSKLGIKSYVNLVVSRDKDERCNIYKFIAVSYKQKIKNKIKENKLSGLINID